MPRIKTDPLDTLAATINREHAAGESARRKGLDHYRAAGAALIEAKSQCGRRWLKWLAANVEVSRTTAYRYMELAKFPVTGTLEEQEAEWRRISGNAPAEPLTDETEPKAEPESPETNDSPTVTPVEQKKKPAEDRPAEVSWELKFMLPRAQKAELEKSLRYLLEKVFHTDSVEATIIAAVQFAREHANA